jgi:hypothetical protein
MAEDKPLTVHLTFDTSVSVYPTLSLEDLNEMTGLKMEILETYADHELEELVNHIPPATLKEIARHEFSRKHGLAVSHADIELALIEIYPEKEDD